MLWEQDGCCGALKERKGVSSTLASSIPVPCSWAVATKRQAGESAAGPEDRGPLSH